MNVETLKKKIHDTLKLCGFNIRREFCAMIVNKYVSENIDLDNNYIFENCIKSLCISLESQCPLEHCVEKEHVIRALENCISSSYDKHETIFNVVPAFEFPKMYYNIDRKQYFLCTKRPQLLSNPDSKASIFLDRYNAVLHRTKRNFLKKVTESDSVKLELQTVDYLLTHSNISLNHTLILGSLLQISEGKYCLEDPTGIVNLDLSDAVYYGGFFNENCFVLVNGNYEDKIIKVSTVILPPGEEYKDSRPLFNNINYFGGPSVTPLKDSIKLRNHLDKNKNDLLVFFSNLWLDHPCTFEKLEILFDGLDPNPPIAFVFMGDFISEHYSTEKLEKLQKLFSHLTQLINKYSNLVNSTYFIFVPGPNDPCTSHVIPRFPLPSNVTQNMTNVLKKAIFTTNPCRIQYCTREITVFKGDILPKLLQTSIYKPPKNEIADKLIRTIISQGHLCPLPLNALSVHWEFDHTLTLYPLPDLIVIGDRAEPYEGNYKGCQLINPGSFCENGFQFKAYNPSSNSVDDCVL